MKDEITFYTYPLLLELSNINLDGDKSLIDSIDNVYSYKIAK